MTAARLTRRVDTLRKLAQRHPPPHRAPTRVSRELLRDDPVRVAAVIEVMLAARLLDRFCLSCPGSTSTNRAAEAIWAANWRADMPWNFCACCGARLLPIDSAAMLRH
jgi:hypothetical protein